MANKIKTNKAMAKRIKVTKTGKLIHQKAWVSHLLTNKNKAQRQNSYGLSMHESEVKKVRNLIPYM